MSNPTFTTAVPDTLPPDPSKHVNYTQGMVLGVDDFQQEFAYLSNRDQWLARDAIGYGTVCGLHVSIDPADPNRISVSPGVAINPRGQLIRVTPRQCAQIDAWLGLPTTTDRMNKLGLGGSGDFTAYVVLCYRDCPVDELPVPGEPCRCDSTTTAPSRIIDDFRLELTLEAPRQTEEDYVRDFVTWLRGVEVADFIPAAGELEAFLQAIRDAFGCADSPPQSPPDFMFESPPAGLRIPHALLCEWMRAALRLWVTELRPCWQAQCAPKKSCACGGPCGCHGTGAQPDDMGCDCLLLAAVRISRGGGGNITSVELDEERRPYLVHLRMLQELLYCGPSCCDSCGDSRTFATVIALDEDTLQIWIHHPVQLSLPDAALALTLGGMPITDFTISPTGPNLFEITLGSSPPQSMGNAITIELEFDANLILEPDGRPLATAIWQERYCYHDYVEPRLHVFAATGTLALAGDVVGPPGNNWLLAIQGKLLNVAGVANQQVLGFDNGIWHPVTMPLPATNAPLALGVAFKGNLLNNYALEDHVHPAPPPPVIPQPGNNKPKADAGTGAKGSSLNYSREDHVHPLQQVTGDFVEYPPFGFPYAIVAAGFLLGQKNTVDPSYNELRFLRVLDNTPGQVLKGQNLLLTYGPPNSTTPLKGYVQPKADHAYIIKGTSFGITSSILTVTSFEKDGFVVNFGQTQDVPSVSMIEVSMYSLKAVK